MGFHRERRHVIDLLFPISLFLIFALSALGVILMASSIYGETANASTESTETRTVISYLTEKIRHQDTSQSISCGLFDDHDALILHHTYGEKNYTTYIYEEDGWLRELFVQDGIAVSASDGKAILTVSNLQIEQLDSQRLRFSCQAPNGVKAERIVSLRSIQE